MAAVLAWSLVGCSSFRGSSSSRIETSPSLNSDAAKPQFTGQLSEVAPPPAIQKLSQSLEAYQPQVAILTPRADQVLQDTSVSVQFQVQDLPLFKDPDLGLGPHLNVILDNQPYQAVYDLDHPIVFEDLAPGTHTLRVFASRPWHESFKNEGAYAQTTFHVFTKSTDNNPEPAIPLLTYSRPTGSYGAEPIMLDFYLTNAPLHLVAQENPDDDIADWRIRVTINGESFVLDRWQPIYLKGFKRGKNWVKLEFLDEQGNPVKNVFNNTVRLISYEPKGKDTLSKLVRGEISADAARGIVTSGYQTTPTLTPAPSPLPTVTPEPIPSTEPSVEETPTPELETPLAEPTPSVESPTTSSESPSPVEEPTSTEQAPPSEPVTEPKSRFGSFFNRFRRPSVAPSPLPEQSELEVPTNEPVIVPEETEPMPEPEVSPTPTESPSAVEEPTPIESPSAVEEPTPTEEATPTTPVTEPKPKFGSFFNRFRRPAATPSEQPAIPEVLDAPSSEPVVVPEQTEPPASEEEPTIPPELTEPELEPTPVITPVPIRPIQPEKSLTDDLLKGDQSPATNGATPTPNSELPPTLPEIVGTPEPKLSQPEVSPSPKSEAPASEAQVTDLPLGEETIPETR
ncbi:hypothetical protein [Allocoleopsis franciscana]